MDQISEVPTKQIYGTPPKKHTSPGTHRGFWITLWIIGLQAALFDVSQLNNPIPSVISAAIVVGALLLLRWWRQSPFFVAAVATAGGLFLFLTPLVARPRPSVKNGVCVHDILTYYSFPSGHVTHDVVCYGFLLYLTFTKPAREWRYRWVLIPLQVFFICDLLFIGYSRVLEGDHWLFDVLGGYLTGALWLLLFIFLYRWATNRWIQYRHKKIAEKLSIKHENKYRSCCKQIQSASKSNHLPMGR